MITTIIAACAGLIAAILAVWILPRFLEVPEDPSKPDILIRLSFLLPVPYAVIGFVQRNTLGFSELAFAGTVLWFLYVFAVTDIRKKIIPNRLLLWMLGLYLPLAAAVFLETGLESGLKRLILSGMGCVLMGGVFLIAYFLSRRQLGGGDVKLVALMGLYLTASRIMGAVFYGLLFCAVYSIIQMVRKKLGRKDGVPLAPFLLAGTFLCYLLRL